MFTGIVEEVGTIKTIKKKANSASITIQADLIMDDLKEGDSVAVNGICLTVNKLSQNACTMDVMNVTLRCTNLGELTAGSNVNLERAMPMNGRFGGHIVSGHIDGIGRITNIRKEDIAIWFTIQTTPDLMRYIIEKGSIAVDGISLTVAKKMGDRFMVSTIPHTRQQTILAEKNIGSKVNLENDIIGKYVEQFAAGTEKLSKEYLIKNGF